MRSWSLSSNWMICTLKDRVVHFTSLYSRVKILSNLHPEWSEYGRFQQLHKSVKLCQHFYSHLLKHNGLKSTTNVICLKSPALQWVWLNLQRGHSSPKAGTRQALPPEEFNQIKSPACPQQGKRYHLQKLTNLAFNQEADWQYTCWSHIKSVTTTYQLQQELFTS